MQWWELDSNVIIICSRMLSVPEVKRTGRSSREKLQPVGDIRKDFWKDTVFKVGLESRQFADNDGVRRRA